MAITDILNYYEEVKEDLKFQSTSSVRTKIMIALSEGPKKTEDLQKSTGISPQTILHSINELEKHDLASSNEDCHYLSKIGEETVTELIDMIKTLTVLKNIRKLWVNHEISAIPDELLMEIGALSNSELIESENTNVGKTHETHIQMILNAKKLRGVSPIFYSDYTKTFIDILEKGVEVELILTETILRKTIKSSNQGEKELAKLISAGNLTLWKTKEDVKVAFTVTDKSIILGLFSTNGTYDFTKILRSDNEDAIAWGNKLFNYYLKRAQKVNLEDIKGELPKYQH